MRACVYALMVMSMMCVVVIYHHATAARNIEYIWIGENCPDGPHVIAQDDTDPVLQGCSRVDTYTINEVTD